ncbi:MAG: hypothetical protein J0M08_00400 [Bacteroidetes bacterium]|nr:hypothetical protein [Bacteroidota bacterium]
MSFRKQIKLLFFAIVLTIFSTSCNFNKTKSDVDELAQKITVSEENVVRGVYLGMSPSEVLKAEVIKASVQEANYLLYEATTDSSDTYTIAYTFDEDSLSEIRIDVYTISEAKAAQLLIKLKEFFANKYDDPITENNTLFIWGIKLNGIPMRIELADESEEYKQGKISLTIYKDN